MPAVWNIDCANAVNVYDVKRRTTKAVIGDATLTAKLIDSAGVDVPGSNFSLPVLDAVTGHYGGESPSQSLTRGVTFELEILGVKSGQTIRRDRIPVVAGYATGS